MILHDRLVTPADRRAGANDESYACLSSSSMGEDGGGGGEGIFPLTRTLSPRGEGVIVLF